MSNRKANETAKFTLKENGFYTGNLWSIEDVMNKFTCSDDEAQKILNNVMTNETLMISINEMILKKRRID